MLRYHPDKGGMVAAAIYWLVRVKGKAALVATLDSLALRRGARQASPAEGDARASLRGMNSWQEGEVHALAGCEVSRRQGVHSGRIGLGDVALQGMRRTFGAAGARRLRYGATCHPASLGRAARRAACHLASVAHCPRRHAGHVAALELDTIPRSECTQQPGKDVSYQRLGQAVAIIVLMRLTAEGV
jgi:hypothetical protein